MDIELVNDNKTFAVDVDEEIYTILSDPRYVWHRYGYELRIASQINKSPDKYVHILRTPTESLNLEIRCIGSNKVCVLDKTIFVISYIGTQYGWVPNNQELVHSIRCVDCYQKSITHRNGYYERRGYNEWLFDRTINDVFIPKCTDINCTKFAQYSHKRQAGHFIIISVVRRRID